MATELITVILAVSFIATAITAVGSRLLVDFSRRELEMYCRRRKLGERFAEIMAAHDRVVLAVDSARTVSFVLVLASGAALLFQGETPSLQRFTAIVVLTSLPALLILNWIPNALVKIWSAPLLTRTWPLWCAIEYAAFPLTLGVGWLDTLARRAAGRPEQNVHEEEEAFEEEIRAIVTSGMREGFMEEDAREMIEGVMDLADGAATNIMTPRGKIDAIEVGASWSELLEFVTSVGRTRLPVYQGALDNVVGVLYAKDLLPELSKEQDTRREWRELVRQPTFVPASIPVDELLRDFQSNRRHLAVVVDEYGAVAGVVTIEDVLEEIVGEIHDESDLTVTPNEFKPIDSETTDVAARAQIEDVNDRLGLAIPESDVYDTLGGYLIAKLGYIPEVGELVEEEGYDLTVRESDRRRIVLVRVHLRSPQRESA